ncbi:MAG: XRE family transcriptional regulator [Firmicutes bacterium HGW-Firmicutes-5]|nr:MAG: XRE family transcriptional regulator [Firmicutes bacterium HGW-Firmicutes-5]
MMKKLKSLRIESELTHKDMASVLGLKTASAYWKKEAGLVPFSLSEARIIADFFNMSIDDIFFSG